jgi:hypothetical protein
VPRCRDLKEHLRRLQRQQDASESRRHQAVTARYAHEKGGSGSQDGLTDANLAGTATGGEHDGANPAVGEDADEIQDLFDFLDSPTPGLS